MNALSPQDYPKIIRVLVPGIAGPKGDKGDVGDITPEMEALLADAEAARETAVQAANDAQADADAAQASETDAEAAATKADAAAGVAIGATDIYPDTASGIAGAGEGGYFEVIAGDGLSATIYHVESGAAVAKFVVPAASRFDAVATYADQLTDTDTRTDALVAATEDDDYSIAFARNQNSTSALTLGFSDWACAVDTADMPANSFIDAVSADLQCASGADHVVLKLWERSMGSASLNGPPGSTGDALLRTQSYSLASLNLQANAAQVKTAHLALSDGVRARTGYTYLAEFDVQNASNVRVTVGIGTNNVTTTDQRHRGFYRPTVAAGSFSNVSGTIALSIAFKTKIFPPDLARMAEAAGADLSDITASIEAIADRSLATRASTGTQFISSNLKGWAVAIIGGVDVPVGAPIRSFAADFQVAATAATVRLTLFVRPASAESAWLNALPQSDPRDDWRDLVSRTVAEAGITPGGAMVNVEWALNRPIIAEADTLYCFAFEARDSGNDRVASASRFTDQISGLTNQQRGWYRNSSDLWNVYSAGYAISGWTIKSKAYGVPALSDFEETAALANALAASFNLSPVTVAIRPAQGYFASGLGFKEWAVGVIAGTDFTAGIPVTAIAASLQAGAGTQTMRLKLWSRPSDAAWLATPPGNVSDTLIAQVDLTIAEAGIIAGGSLGTVRWPVSFSTTAGLMYIPEFSALDGGGTRVAIGAGYTQAVTGLSDQQRGWYRNTADIWTVIGTGFGLGWEFDGQRYAAPQELAAPGNYQDEVLQCEAAAAGLVVTISNSFMGRKSTLIPFAGSVTLAAPTTGHVIDEARTLIGNNRDYGIVNPAGRLAFANVSNVLVKDAGTLTALVENTDYLVGYPHGVVTGVDAAANRAVLVTYDWSKRRYDLIYLDPETMALGVVHGSERDRDAAEYKPAIGNSKPIPLFFARVTAGAVELVPCWQIKGDETRVSRVDLSDDRRISKRFVRNTLKKLRRGEALTVGVYGDSICALQRNPPPATTPNGIERDRAADGYLNGAIDPALIAALPRYDHGDGAGAVHTHFGFGWELVAALGQAFGSTITYENWGVGATSSASSAGNGLDPARLNAMLAGAAHVMLVEFGMNELGSSTTETNIVQIVQAIRGAGKEAIVMGLPRINAWRYQATDTSWEFTNRALRRAALYAGAAFVDTSALESLTIGSMSLSAQDCCQANLMNHPGIFEHKAFGRAAAAFFIDE